MALVYLGDQLPEYAYQNLKYLNSSFPKINLVLLSDNPAILDSVKSLGIETWHCSNPRDSWNAISENWELSRRFRDDFWFKTLARFYSLYEFMKAHPEESVLHVEADVLLLNDFPFYAFEELLNCISYPLKSDSEGIASILYISDLSVAQKLMDHIEAFNGENEFTTDVAVLGSFSKRYSDLYFPVPSSLPFNYIEANSSKLNKTKLWQNLDYFGGIFDASSLGIFFTGEDPRNANGYLKLFSLLDHPIPVGEFHFNFECPNLYVTYDGATAKVYSLHIHSKDLRLFDDRKYQQRIEYLVSRHQLGELLESRGLQTIRIKIRDYLVTMYLNLKSWFS